MMGVEFGDGITVPDYVFRPDMSTIDDEDWHDWFGFGAERVPASQH
jgi:hypothetical protein